MLQRAIEAEVDEFLQQHQDRRDGRGNRQVVRNGHLQPRKITTGAGPLEVRQPRVRDNSPNREERVQFSSAILPPYLRRSKAIEEFIPWLYLKGISTGDFSEVLQSLLGERAKGLSPNVIVRLKDQWTAQYEAWNRRDLTGKQYVYFWADGIHVNVRLEDTENKRQCLRKTSGNACW
jgi:transposase-like protein